MRLGLIGKFPPIQGGVSARTYRLAHGLAGRGHEVHVITNNDEVEEAFRIRMGESDAHRLEGRDPSGGFVQLHRTRFAPEAQRHVPWHNPFVSKLTGLAIEAIEDHDLECLISWYLEPYAVAGLLASRLTGIPHVVKTAGSDVGRLWHQPGLRTMYDRVFLDAAAIVAGGSLPVALREIGVDPARIVPGDPPWVPLEEFHPAALPLPEVRDRVPPGSRVVGIYGKLGPFKGGADLLRAARTCLDAGVDVTVAAMVQGRERDEAAFQAVVDALDLARIVLRVPFQPHWRVPGFLTACDVVCCLEQDFPIRAHAPVIAQEVMASGTPAVLSREIAEKQPDPHRLIHGYNCWIVEDATDSEALASCIRHALRDEGASEVGARAVDQVRRVQERCTFPEAYERAVFLATGKLSPATGSSGIRGRSALAPLLERVDAMLASAVHGVEEGTRDAAWYAKVAVDLAARSHPSAFAAQLAAQVVAVRESSPRGPATDLFRGGTKGAFRACRLGDRVPRVAEGALVQPYGVRPLESLVEGSARGGPTTVVALPSGPRQPVRVLELQGLAAAIVEAADGRTAVDGLAPSLAGDGPSIQAMVERLHDLGVLALG